MKNFKRILSAFLTVAMIAGCFVTTAFAADGEGTAAADTTAAQFLSLSFSFPVSALKVSSNAPRSPYTLPFSFHICAAPAQAS